jgi:hypothetical protein
VQAAEYQATVYKHSLGVPRSTASLLTFLEVGRYPMQIQWLAVDAAPPPRH